MSSSDFSEYSVDEPSFDEATTRNEALIKRLRAAGSSAEALGVISEWDALFCQFKEWSSLTYIRFSQDTKNPDYAAAKERLDSVSPMFTDLEVQMKNEILASPLRRDLTRELPPQLFDLWQCQANAFSPEIEDDLTEELRLESRHTALTAGAEILFRGETYNLSGIGKYFEDGDRDTRRGAYIARSRWFADHAEELDAIYDDQVRVRDAMAKKLGFTNFVDMAYQRRTRIGYGPEEVATFRDQVRDVVGPLCVELADDQARALGIDKVMRWDDGVLNTSGNPKPGGDAAWMTDRATEMFTAMGHGLDAFFELMNLKGTMDLDTREGKAGGGYCDFLHKFGCAFIFANFNGTRGDVDVFTHEMGHAFQSYSSKNQPVSDLVWPTTEACEIHSMALEFLTWPHMDLFYGPEDAEEIRRAHLTGSLMFLPYGVAIDHFQHLVYASPQASPDERNAMWKKMERIYLPWYRYGRGDLPAEEAGRLWQMKQHLYNAPFYYVDYCLALTGALQFWRRSRTDRDGALDAYAELCQKGGSLPFDALVESAGLTSPFTAGCLDGVVGDAREFLSA